MIKITKVLFLSICLILAVYLSISAQTIFDVQTNDLDYSALLFITPRGLDSCLVTDLAGNEIYRYQLTGRCQDFKRLDNGDWIYFDNADDAWKQHAAYSDTVKATYSISGSDNDGHDIIIGKDYIWLMGRQEYTALSGTLVITLKSSTIQKQDMAGNILFDWRSQDHIAIDEAAFPLRPGGSYPHSNGFFEDTDGNLLVSFRNTSSVVKICATEDDCNLGEIIWRLGGTKSDFAFANDGGFSGQHSVIIADKCHDSADHCLLLFDNGVGRDPHFSRGVEYILGVGVITKTWEYTAGGKIYAFATGNIQRLDTGDTVIGWGSARRDNPRAPTVTVVDWGGGVRYEATLAGDATSYRAHLYPVWRIFLPVVRE